MSEERAVIWLLVGRPEWINGVNDDAWTNSQLRDSTGFSPVSPPAFD
jgi:hypothetical protein